MTESGGTHVSEPVATEPSALRLRILHLSDPVLTAHSPATAQVLDDLLHDLRHLRDVDLVVVSGDVVGDATSTTYVAARRAVGGFAAAHGAPHVYALGDRDDHTGFADILGSGHLAPDDIDVGHAGPEAERRGWCSDLDGLRVVTLDTTVPGARHGQLGESQAQWLSEVLRTPSPRGTVVVLHHPPVSPHGHRRLAGLALRDPEKLAEAIRGSDVHVVLAGHVGVDVGGMLAGVPVLVAPGVAGRTDLSAPAHLDRTVRGAGAQVVDLGGPCSPQSHTVWARDPRAGELLELSDPATGRSVAGEDLPQQPLGAPAPPGPSLSQRIPQGETPAPSAAGEATSWPTELDSSTRVVRGAPHSVPARSDPVWLDDDTEAMPATSTATSPTSRTEPPVTSPTPAPAAVAPARTHSDLEETIVLAAAADLDRRIPASRLEGWAPEPQTEPAPDGPEAAVGDDQVGTDEAGERDGGRLGTDDSGVLSWAFAEADDDTDDPAPAREDAAQPRQGSGR